MMLVGTLKLNMLSILYLLSRIKVFLYKAYIIPQFDLCCAIWGNCTLVKEDKLVKLQKRAARAILDVDFTVPSETMFTQFKWMTFPERVVCHKAKQMHSLW